MVANWIATIIDGIVHSWIRLAGAFLICVALAAGGNEASAEPQPERYSVLLITLDTTRADHLGAYSSTRKLTPNLDALAAEGVVFENVRTQVPITSPSHSTIMTGMGVLEHGVHDNGTFTLPDRVLTLAEVFREAEYRTGAFVSAVVLDHKYGIAQGFETYDDEMTAKGPEAFQAEKIGNFERPAGETTARALRWLADAEKPELERPFFLWVHYYDPHARHVMPKGFENIRSRYGAEIAYVDQQIGVLLKAARATRERLLIVVASDHGENFGEHGLKGHGRDLYDPVMRTALIFQGHERVQAGTRVAQSRSLRDVAGTIADLIGMDAVFPSSNHLLPVQGQDSLATEPLYLETMLPSLRFDDASVRGVIQDGWKLIEWEDIDASSAPRVELYHLTEDPDESSDLSARHPERVESMRAVIEELVEQSKARGVTSETQELDEETRKKLQALGYIEG